MSAAEASTRPYITDPAPAPVAEPAAVAAPNEQLSPAGDSLAARVKARRELLESEQTTVLDLPGYEGILAAEYRLLSWQAGRKISAPHRDLDDPDLQVLYSAADYLLAAHVTFHDTRGDEPVAIDETWASLCGRASITLLPGATERQAMIAMLEDGGVIEHFAAYEAWKFSRGRKVTEAVVRDFEKTG